MKLFLILVGAIIACGAAYNTYKFYSSPDINTVVFINRDNTDSLLAEPDTSIFNYLHLSDNLYQGVQITCTSLTEFEYNSEYVSSLPRQLLLVSNPTARQTEISGFYSRTALNIMRLNAEKAPRKKSSLYTGIARQLNQLATMPGHTKLDFVFSNLEENTSDFSVYNTKDYKMLKDEPDSVGQLFLRALPLENLTGITVYFVFKPAALQDENRFLLMMQVFKKMITNAGATVIVKADLKTTG
jgi:hypothetical protein